MRLLKQKVAPAGRVGIEIGPDGMALCRVLHDEGGKPTLTRCDFIHATGEAALADKLSAWVNQYGLTGSAATWVLHPNDYRLLLADRPPNVPDNELAMAVKWSIKDMVSFPIEEAIVDAFLPKADIEGHKTKCYCAVAQSSYLAPHAALIKKAGLSLDTITIQEAVLLDWLQASSSGESSAVLALWSSCCLLLVQQAGTLTMVRNINQGLRALMAAGTASGLVEEVARSFSYCQNQLKQTPPDNLCITPVLGSGESIVEELQTTLPVVASMLAINDELVVPNALADDVEAHCFSAIAAARVPVQTRVNLMTMLCPSAPTQTISIEKLGIICASWFAALMLVFGVGYAKNSARHTQLNAAIAQKDKAQRLLNDLKTKIPPGRDESLIDEVDALQTRIRSQADVVGALKAMAHTNTHGYADMLSALGKALPADAWLTQMAISSGNADIYLSGKARSSAQVPIFAAHLQQSLVFKGVHWDVMTIKHLGANGVSFVLGTTNKPPTGDFSAEDANG